MNTSSQHSLENPERITNDGLTSLNDDDIVAQENTIHPGIQVAESQGIDGLWSTRGSFINFLDNDMDVTFGGLFDSASWPEPA